MLIHPMVERLRGLGLAAMADAFTEMQRNAAADDLSREDWFGLLIDREATARENKRLGRRLTQARLRQSATVEDADLRTPRGLDRGLFHKLATCDWIRDSQHLLIGGPTGVGKSWLACALGHKACRDGFSVIYRRAPRLFADLATARGEGRLTRLMTTLAVPVPWPGLAVPGVRGSVGSLSPSRMSFARARSSAARSTS